MVFILPRKLISKWPQAWKNLNKNKNRLITLFNLHATLRNLLEFQLSNLSKSNQTENFQMLIKTFQSHPSRGTSLFKPIASNLTCAEAFILPQWCACLNWIQIKFYKLDKLFKKLILKIINHSLLKINQLVELYSIDEHDRFLNGKCAIYELDQVRTKSKSIRLNNCY